jgi:hypothetical protein
MCGHCRCFKLEHIENQWVQLLAMFAIAMIPTALVSIATTIVLYYDIKYTNLIIYATVIPSTAILITLCMFYVARWQLGKKQRKTNVSVSVFNLQDLFGTYEGSHKTKAVIGHFLALLAMVAMSVLWYLNEPVHFIASNHIACVPTTLLLLWWIWISWIYAEIYLGYYLKSANNVIRMLKNQKVDLKDTQRILNGVPYLSVRAAVVLMLALLSGLSFTLAYIAYIETNNEMILGLAGFLTVYYSLWQVCCKIWLSTLKKKQGSFGDDTMEAEHPLLNHVPGRIQVKG